MSHKLFFEFTLKKVNKMLKNAENNLKNMRLSLRTSERTEIEMVFFKNKDLSSAQEHYSNAHKVISHKKIYIFENKF